MLDSIKIKEFILNPDVHLSNMAIQYFDDTLCTDEEILNIVLDRCHNLNENEKIHLLADISNLKLNLDSINKIIANLSDATPKLRFIYERLLSNADGSLIRLTSLDSQVLNPEFKIALNQKLNVSTFSTKDLLDELIDFSIKNDSKDMNEFNMNYGRYLVDELSRREDLDEAKIIEDLTSVEFDEYSYFECFLLILAGKRKLTVLIPLLINGLGHSDFISEECMYALMRIGSADIIDSIIDKYFDRDEDFKIYAIGVLENIKILQSEKAALKLLEKETDLTLKTLLAGALCQLYSIEAIPQIKRLIEEGYDASMLNLEEIAYVNCVFNGLDIPEMSLWKESFDEEKTSYLSPPVLNTPVISKDKAGRNDPCPCGSGKKYKKCCGKD